jgi:ribosome biogenesis GTPase A
MSSESERSVEWYPGHMARAAHRIREYLATIDVVVEVVDARIPCSGRNPLLAKLAARQKHIVALSRQDLADSATTTRWLDDFSDRGLPAIAVDGRAPRSVARVASAMNRLAAERPSSKRVSRAMVVGIPNSGKSSIVNGLVRRAVAKTQERAGVTRQLQWFRVSRTVELMDTPGILPPKIRDTAAQWRLAICGAVPNDRYDPEEVAGAFHRWLVARHARTRVPDLRVFASARGFRRRGGETDYHNAAQSYIRALRDGAFGRISFESPDDLSAA